MKIKGLTLRMTNETKHQRKKTLGLWEEYLGILINFFYNRLESSMFLQFSSGTLLMIPFSNDLKNRLNDSIGKRVGVLHTDLDDKEYLIRIEDQEI